MRVAGDLMVTYVTHLSLKILGVKTLGKQIVIRYNNRHLKIVFLFPYEMTRRPYKSTTLRMLVNFVWVRCTCETSQVLLARVPCFFFFFFFVFFSRGFRPTYRFARLIRAEIILKGTLNGTKIVQSLVMSTASI